MKDIGTIFGYEAHDTVYLGKRGPTDPWYENIGNDIYVVWNGCIPYLLGDAREVFQSRVWEKGQIPTASEMVCGLQNKISDRDYSDYEGSALFGSGEGISSLKTIRGGVGVSWNRNLYAHGPLEKDIYKRLPECDPFLDLDPGSVLDKGYEIIEILRNNVNQTSAALRV